MIAGPLVATKLFVPRLRAGVVERQRLSARLDSGASAKLTLISAPAGFGKTTLVSAWLATRSAGDRAVAWLSLDQTDNNAMSFWAHAVAALQKAAAATGVEALSILEPGQHPIDDVLTSIVNGLSGLPNAIDLVLDDYHVIDATEVQTGIEFLLEHLNHALGNRIDDHHFVHLDHREITGEHGFPTAF